MARSELFISLVLHFLYLLHPTHSEEFCHAENSCICHFSDNHVVNLEKIAPNKDFISAKQGNLTFFYHGCTDAEFHKDMEISTDSCRGKLTLCLFNATDKSLSGLGSASKSVISQTQQKSEAMQLNYETNNIHTSVILVCTVEFQQSFFVNKLEANKYELFLFSPEACKHLDNTGMSTGSKLVIMLFVFSSLYFIGGACIAYFIRGARGREMIPNVEFWTKIPGLVRDGIIYLQNGCNPRMVPSQDSYDQI